MSFGLVAEIMTLARKFNTYEKYAASGTTYWTDTTHYRITCPADKRMFILYGMHNAHVSATRTISIHNVGDDLIQMVHYLAAGTGGVPIPDTVEVASTVSPAVWPLILDEGEYFEILFGAVQDTDSLASFTILEIPYP